MSLTVLDCVDVITLSCRDDDKDENDKEEDDDNDDEQAP